MKKILILALTMFSSLSLFATSPEFHDAMLNNIRTADTTKNYNDYIALAGTFEQIASVEKMEWLPLYYAAYCYVSASFGIPDEDKKDAMADKALELTQKAQVLRPTESELFTMLGFANIAKLSAKPMLRGMTYPSTIRDLLAKACEQNPSNPRPVYLAATLTYYSPEFIGGGKEKALPQLNEALEKFNTFKPVSDLHPNWGKGPCEGLIKSANSK